MKNRYRIQNLFFLFIFISKIFSQSTGIQGKITDAAGQPIPGVNIVVTGTLWGTSSGPDGVYRLEKIPAGTYTLIFKCIGYRTEIKENVQFKATETLIINIQLVEEALRMQEIVVMPGNFTISQNQTTRLQEIRKEKIEAIPATLDDIYRVLQIMPGVAFSDDYSAHFHVRGGKQSENLILLDGMEIYDPYHLKHIGGAIGVMNMELIDDVSILTGGFSAKYGDKLSSVVAIQNRTGNQKRVGGQIEAGGTGISMVMEGPMPRGNWILSYRKSFLKEAAEILNPTDYTYSPSFYDTQAKLNFDLNPNNHLVFNFLFSKDETYLEKWRNTSDLNSNYGNRYYGLVWRSFFHPKLLSELILSGGQNFWDNTMGGDKKEELNLREQVANWNLNFQPRETMEFETGVTYKKIDYRYELQVAKLSTEQQELEELIESYYGDQNIHPETYKIACYLQNKFRFLKRLYATWGVRYDYFDYIQSQKWSPRLGLAWNPGSKTVLRFAWGLFYQAPDYVELTRDKGAVANPSYAKATHYVIGIEHFVTNNFNIRIEGYLKPMSQMPGHYFEMDEETNKPILRYGNPNSGNCRGIEIFINGKILPSLSMWLAYAYSQARLEAFFVNWNDYTIEQKLIPRFTDQPHNFSMFLNFQLPKRWEANLKWRYLSGIPYTPAYPDWREETAVWRSGEIYADRYPAYHRLDFRVGKKFIFSRFQLTSFLEIKNLYNRHNVLLYDYKITNNTHLKKAFHTLPFLPTIEFKLAF